MLLFVQDKPLHSNRVVRRPMCLGQSKQPNGPFWSNVILFERFVFWSNPNASKGPIFSKSFLMFEREMTHFKWHDQNVSCIKTSCVTHVLDTTHLLTTNIFSLRRSRSQDNKERQRQPSFHYRFLLFPHQKCAFLFTLHCHVENAICISGMVIAEEHTSFLLLVSPRWEQQALSINHQYFIFPLVFTFVRLGIPSIMSATSKRNMLRLVL